MKRIYLISTITLAVVLLANAPISTEADQASIKNKPELPYCQLSAMDFLTTRQYHSFSREDKKIVLEMWLRNNLPIMGQERCLVNTPPSKIAAMIGNREWLTLR